MGVDGFRIDTSGHISRLTFCKEFIPQFAALGEKYKSKRLNQAPFFMYGEICSRYSEVQYRGQDNLSCYYYTWMAPKALLDQQPRSLYPHKRAYKDSYALVALNGGATFTGCPAGTYTDIVTGQTYSGPTITIDAPHTQGQVRVLVKDWTGGKVGEDGPFIYTTSAQHKGNQAYDGNEEAGTTWNTETPIPAGTLSLSQAGGSFCTDNLTIKVTLSENTLGGWYQVEGQGKVMLNAGETKEITIGDDMKFNETKNITWGYTLESGKEKTGTYTYKKLDPKVNEKFYAYFAAPVGWSVVKAWVWDAKNNNRNYTGGSWPGELCVKTGETYQGKEIWKWEYNGDLTAMPTHIIFNNGNSGTGNQTADMLFQNGKCYDFNGVNSDIVITGIKGISGGTASGKVKIFNLNGVKVAEVSHVEDAEYILAPGVYIAGSKEFVIK